MSENKTKPNSVQVEDFLNGQQPESRREDCLKLDKLMSKVTGEQGVMWGSSIIGYGKYHYKYASGREGDYLAIGFSPRKASITVYAMDGYEKYSDLLERLGKCSTGKSCLYIKKLADINLDVLEELLRSSYQFTIKNSK